MTETKKRGAAAKVLMPVVATLASAAASYLAKKGPQYLEQTLLPKMKDKTESATSGVGDVAHDLTERAKSVVGHDGSDSAPSLDDLEKRRQERAEHRAARRKAS
jgi:hypothetical protein